VAFGPGELRERFARAPERGPRRKTSFHEKGAGRFGTATGKPGTMTQIRGTDEKGQLPTNTATARCCRPRRLAAKPAGRR